MALRNRDGAASGNAIATVSRLVSGTNTLAIGVWNQTASSSDLILVPQLTIKTNADNCPLVPNPDQADTDGDGDGDACDL